MDREIRPRLRLVWIMVIGLVLILLGMLLSGGGAAAFPPPLLLMAFGLIALVRAGVIMLIGGRADSAFATNPVVAAATLAPFVMAGLGLFLAYASGTLPGGIGSAIVCLVFAGGIIYWIFQYRLGEMVYRDGIWASKERWLDPAVSKATQDRWGGSKTQASGRG